jgi:aldehyde dehydrogenase (NAD+)
MQNENFASLLNKQKDFFLSGVTKNIDFRIETLRKLKSIIKDHEQEILDAIYHDLHKTTMDGYATEIAGLYNEINYAISNIHKWAKEEKVKTPSFLFPSKSYVYRQPYGSVLIIAPWNYPFQLLMLPLVGAIAAGNTAILKPSEISTHTEKVTKKIINNNFPPEFIHVLLGSTVETQTLVNLPFDYIFFTGSPSVGKAIMSAAANNLVPLTLELGGKSPAVVHADANITLAARKIAWGKFINAGQTCIAPDYVLVHASIKDKFLAEIKKTILEFYGEDPYVHPRYCRIINSRHFQRLTGLLEGTNIFFGGKTISAERYIEPTVIYPAKWQEPIMQEEIFGPLLPVLVYSDIQEAIKKIRQLPKPLSLYLFTDNKIIQKKIISDISFGGGAINNTIFQIVSHFMPFGGVGASGMGSYHGRASFETFSHTKSMLKSSSRLDPLSAAYPHRKYLLKIIKKIIGE